MCALSLFNLTEERLGEGISNSTTSAGTRLMWPAFMQLSGTSELTPVLGQLGAKSLASQSFLTLAFSILYNTTNGNLMR